METPEPKKLFAIYPSPICKTYGVVLKFSAHYKVHYEIEVSYLRELEDGSFLFELDKKQVYINEKAPNKTIDKLADQMGKILYPLTVKTNKKGVLTEVANMEFIKQRWQQEKQKVIQGYEGEVVASGISAMELALGNDDRLTELVRKDWFLALFFSGIYGLQAKDIKEPLPFRLPFIPYAPMVSYAITREITEKHGENKCFSIKYEGIVAELWGMTKAKGTLNATFKLYHQDFTVRSITGDVSFIPIEEKEKNINFEIYHLAEKDKSIKSTQDNQNDESTDKVEKKSFWNFFK
ncbi:hypothetical protein H7F33_16935 [Pedobacter sp. PAMC26386]|nr:hypothetical protein H7F33_16935 [Pedobacter sp. PAMC26386]